MKNNLKRIKNFFSNYFIKYVKAFFKYIKKNKRLIYKGLFIIFTTIPFFIIDIFTRYFGRKIDFFELGKLVPNLFTIIWIILIIGICFSFSGFKRKFLYSLFIGLFLFFFLVNNVYYSVTDSFFDFSLIELASEGSSYLIDSLKNADKIIYIIMSIVIIMTIFIVKYMPKGKKNNIYIGLSCFTFFLIMHIITPTLLGKANADLSWNTWRNPRNIYISFNDNNKSMSLAGFYEYVFRNFYITYIKEKKTQQIQCYVQKSYMTKKC